MVQKLKLGEHKCLILSFPIRLFLMGLDGEVELMFIGNKGFNFIYHKKLQINELFLGFN